MAADSVIAAATIVARRRCERRLVTTGEGVVNAPNHAADCITDDEHVGESDERAGNGHAVTRQELPEKRQMRSNVRSPLNDQKNRSEEKEQPENKPDGDSPRASVQPQQR